jgi:hypothetical protein
LRKAEPSGVAPGEKAALECSELEIWYNDDSENGIRGNDL